MFDEVIYRGPAGGITAAATSPLLWLPSETLPDEEYVLYGLVGINSTTTVTALTIQARRFSANQDDYSGTAGASELAAKSILPGGTGLHPFQTVWSGATANRGRLPQIGIRIAPTVSGTGKAFVHWVRLAKQLKTVST